MPNFGHQFPPEQPDPWISLRDWFAGQARVEECEWPCTCKELEVACDAAGIKTPSGELEFWENRRAVDAFEAKLRYSKADAMLAEREKPHV